MIDYPNAVAKIEAAVRVIANDMPGDEMLRGNVSFADHWIRRLETLRWAWCVVKGLRYEEGGS